MLKLKLIELKLKQFQTDDMLIWLEKEARITQGCSATFPRASEFSQKYPANNYTKHTKYVQSEQ